jgi:hypothetical protein
MPGVVIEILIKWRLRVGGKLYSEVTDPWAEDIGDGDDRVDC